MPGPAYDLIGYVVERQLIDGDCNVTVHTGPECPTLNEQEASLVRVRTCDGPHLCRRCGHDRTTLDDVSDPVRDLPRVPERPPLVAQSDAARRLDPVLSGSGGGKADD